MPHTLLAYGHFTCERSQELEIAADEAGLSLERPRTAA